jgi:hypothetical protein
MGGSDATFENPLPHNPETPGKGISIGITHHLPDFQNNPDYDWLSLDENGGYATMCEKLKNDGVTDIRFDVRWNRVQPDAADSLKGETDTDYIDRSAKIADIGKKMGLENTLVLSSIPKWALNLAKTDPESFRQAYGIYVDMVFSNLAKHKVKAPAAVQIFNELNMSNYTPDALLPQIESCMSLIKEAGSRYFGMDIPLVATLHVSALPFKALPGVAWNAGHFIDSHRDLLSKFDEIKLDYYPGIWHQPPEEIIQWTKNIGYFLDILKFRNDPAELAELNHPARAFIDAFKNMGKLEETLKMLQPLQEQGIEIGIGEIGVPSIVPFDRPGLDHEKLQTLGVGVVLAQLNNLTAKYNLNNIGIYSLMDEPAPEIGAFNWGLYRKDGTPKRIIRSLPQLIKLIGNNDKAKVSSGKFMHYLETNL